MCCDSRDTASCWHFGSVNRARRSPTHCLCGLRAQERKDHHGHDDEHEDEGHEEGKDTVGEISSSIMLDGDQVEKDADAPILSSRVVFTPKKLGLDKQAGVPVTLFQLPDHQTWLQA